MGEHRADRRRAGRTAPSGGGALGSAVRGTGWLVRLLAVVASLALTGYAVHAIVGDSPALLRTALWFAGALVLHDLVLFPLYAAGDRLLLLGLPRTRVPLVNHVRVPVLGSGLALLMFLPGILRQGTATHLAATGLDQEPYRMRWVWLTIALFAVSALVWLVRTLVAHRPRADRAAPGRIGP
ncbi:putative CONSERVED TRANSMEMBRANE PROTEIN [Pseudonocardia sp. Ae168_Ps1]|uniref:hypothetical protein n=1 Tax=unclassified Pseudonocardia TaxID=2619320 RepID=UPI00095CAF43|nr:MULTISPECIES: hypothetical protein [unclassified Pseudonocardia]OLL76557.1 putative CONSERVED TRANSMEMBRANE PROTEIN [Pseudonocardia sp. Ae150A_Ps1]OLL82566.1 putative CONSERVED TRANSMEMBRANE PROTEIN [Pseudonocardia sp. Ae168_Ps1]OLL83319.1 putative CONSERVED TRANSMEMBRANE PROTEIN [Pseudonocardia sp. Ae263_Ps1]OLL90643.1 putative CONSERVED TRANSMEMBRANE PROTEIN [Pseudonocardia sp. Ae356_Ps1]